ncbi:glycosyltransferase [Massilia sp. GCM10023247]|uniref:glycosyltransferase n=1 Tax=Massilia sp. GCM10023247 TaxID=3252643 RepID=UPI00361539AF
MATRPLCIAFIVRDPLPPLRADVLTLFGVEMPRHGIRTELVGQGGEARGASWGAGGMHVVGSLRSRFAGVLAPAWDALGLLRAARRARPDCIQVRDKVASALLARVAARILRVPFVYWMSFPIVEGFEARRDALAGGARGTRGRALWLAHAARARAARFAAYRLVLPGADHVFVQSAAMRDWLAGQGIARARMTAVPMGVDAALLERGAIVPSADPRLDGRRVVLYLGRVARARRSDFLLDVAERLRAHLPASLLVIAGDAPSPDEMAWMRDAIAARGLADHVLLTGWLPQRLALGYAVRAEVGLSPIPRGVLYDVSSPTKLVEYLALGLPGVANDIPDQALVIERSRAGLCVPMQADAFAAATLRLLADRALAAACAERGPPWVRAHRTYAILAREVADAYRRILPPLPRQPLVPPLPPCGPTA